MTIPDVTVERLDPVDPASRDAILALESQSFTNPWSAEGFETMLASPASRVYVARERRGEIVGFCACWLFADELHINTIAVHADWRRRGIATGLLRYILEETGARCATLEVRRSNAAAITLYERLGFKVSAVRQRYYENPPEDGLILWLNP